MEEQVEKLYSHIEHYNSNLKTLCYEAAFEKYRYENQSALNYLRDRMSIYDKPEKALSRMSKHFINIIKMKYSDINTSLPSMEVQHELNLFTSSYVLPAMLSMGNSFMKQLAKEICWYWGKYFKKSNIYCCTFQHNSEYLKKHVSLKHSVYTIETVKANQQL